MVAVKELTVPVVEVKFVVSTFTEVVLVNTAFVEVTLTVTAFVVNKLFTVIPPPILTFFKIPNPPFKITDPVLGLELSIVLVTFNTPVTVKLPHVFCDEGK